MAPAIGRDKHAAEDGEVDRLAGRRRSADVADEVTDRSIPVLGDQHQTRSVRNEPDEIVPGFTPGPGQIGVTIMTTGVLLEQPVLQRDELIQIPVRGELHSNHVMRIMSRDLSHEA